MKNFLARGIPWAPNQSQWVRRLTTAERRYEAALVRRRSQWLYLATQIPGCLEPKRCRSCSKFFLPELVRKDGRCRGCDRARKKAYRQHHPDKVRAHRKAAKHRRRARKIEAGGSFSAENWMRILETHGRCARCGVQENLTADHVIPLSMGGSNDWTNIQPLCHLCNSRKSATITGVVQSFIPGIRTMG